MPSSMTPCDHYPSAVFVGKCAACGDDLPPGRRWYANDPEPPEPDGECYRGGEAAAALAEEQAWIQRNLK